MFEVQISCLIVNYQCGNYLSECLLSLFRTAGDCNLEVLVVDNASTDGSVDAAKELGFPIEWIRLPENVGFARANNLAASRAQGEFLLLLNPDTQLLADCVTPLLEYLLAHKNVGLIGGHHQDASGAWQRSFGLQPRILLEFEYALSPRRYWARLPANPPVNPIQVGWLFGSFVLLRRSLAQQIGLFDERFFLNDEDIDLADRVRQAGLKVVYHPARGLKHFGGVSKALSPSSSSEYKRSRRAYYRKKRGRYAEWAYRAAARLREMRDFISARKLADVRQSP